MSNIKFYSLVEQLLIESVGSDFMSLLSIPGDLTLEKCAIWASLLDRTGVSYLRVDTLIGLRPAWPIIDTLFFIFKVLQNAKVIANLDEGSVKRYASILEKSKNIEEFYKILAKQNGKEEDEYVLKLLKDKANYLLNNYDNYREFSSTKLKQITDETQLIAAEEYLSLTPYEGINRLLRIYGGYDTSTAKNVLYYPGETRYTQSSNIEGPVMGSIVEISKLMLIFYREYIVEQKEKTGAPIVNSILEALKVKDLNEFKKILDQSAGKLSPAGDAGYTIQQDYINFVKGRSVLTIDPNVPPPVDIPVEPPKPAIKHISDFRNISGTSQEIFQAFLTLFNNIKKGPHPSKWMVAGKTIQTGTDTLAGILQALTAVSGHKIYGNT